MFTNKILKRLAENIQIANLELKTANEVIKNIPRRTLIDLLTSYIKKSIIGLSDYLIAKKTINSATKFNNFCNQQGLNDKFNLSENEFQNLIDYFSDRINDCIIDNLVPEIYETCSTFDQAEYILAGKNMTMQQFIVEQFKTLDDDLHQICEDFRMDKVGLDQLEKPSTLKLLFVKYINLFNKRLSKVLEVSSKIDDFPQSFIDVLNKGIKKQVEYYHGLQLQRLKHYLNYNDLMPQFIELIKKSCNKIFTENSIRQYLNNDLNYDNLAKLTTHVIKSWHPLIIQYIRKTAPLPEEVKNNKYFDFDLGNILDKEESITLYFFKKVNKLLLPFTKKKVKHLTDPNSDEIGQQVDAQIKYIDMDNRSRPFIIYDNEFIEGYQGETHSELIARMVNDTTHKRHMRTESINMLQDEIDKNNKSLAFGHLVGKLAFLDIDISMHNISVDEAIKIVISQPNIIKVYTSPRRNNSIVTRLAKLAIKKRRY